MINMNHSRKKVNGEISEFNLLNEINWIRRIRIFSLVLLIILILLEIFLLALIIGDNEKELIGMSVWIFIIIVGLSIVILQATKIKLNSEFKYIEFKKLYDKPDKKEE